MHTATTLFPHKIALAAFAFAALATAPVVAAQDGQTFWTDVDPQQVVPLSDRGVEPLAYRALALDFEALAAHLALAPSEQVPGDLRNGQLVSLPLPDGGFATYRVVESSVMQPGLQRRYPALRTYLGADVATPSALVRVSVTPQGFHAISSRPEGTLYIDPFTQFDRVHVKAYWRHDMPPRDPHLHPPDEVEELDELTDTIQDLIDGRDADGAPRFANGQILRIYRAAIAANRHYTAFHSADEPTVQEGLAAVVVGLNRINLIYERDLAVRMVLVEDNDQIIYTDAEDDPYGNSPSSTVLNQNQTNLDSVIGSGNYDIGHLFITGGGGLATLRGVCHGSWKSRGVSGLPNPQNDPFHVDYVSHEIGHQFGARHTFNSNFGAPGGCAPHRSSATAYEPGSGSTIMAYSGLCGNHNIQGLADDYFHNISLTEMIAFITTGTGSTCGEEVETGNDIPDPVLPAAFQIPILTAFALRGDAEYEGDESMLTFVWEGMDLGAAGPPPGHAAWDQTAPFFRTFQPIASPTRFFPRIDRFIRGQSTLGEGLADDSRLLRFRLTVRNNAPGAGAVRDRQLLVPVAGGAGPFVVTSHNDSGLGLAGGEQVTVTWDVAGTDVSSLGGEEVDILLSLDRHHDLVNGTAIVLAEQVPNDGAATVTIPQGHTATRARIIVRANPGYFFSFNTTDLNLAPVSTDEGAAPAAAQLSPVWPNPVGVASSRGTFNLTVDQAQTVRVALFDALGREVRVLLEGPVAAGVNQQFSVNARELAAGVYYVRATGDRFSLTRPMTIVH